MRSCPVWQIPKAGEAIPDCPGQILLRSCSSRATRRWQAAYQVLDLREKGATRLSGERLHGDAGDGLQATTAGTSSCYPGVSSPKYQTYLGEALMGEAVPESQGRGLERAPSSGWEEDAVVGFTGDSHQSLQPCQGTARGKQAPTRTALPPACSLPSRCWCCQAGEGCVPQLPKPERCHVPRDAGHLLPCLTAYRSLSSTFYPAFLIE